MKYIINHFSIIFILLFVFTSCDSIKRESTSNLETISDLKNKFEIQIDKSWHREFQLDRNKSSIIFSDTTKDLTKTIVFNLSWNPDTVFMNTHLENTMDSIISQYGFKTKNQKLGKIGDFKMYKNHSIGYDSVLELPKHQLLYILKSEPYSGHLLLLAYIYDDSVSLKQNNNIEDVIQTIKMNE
jgi:hypothetical protein